MLLSSNCVVFTLEEVFFTSEWTREREIQDHESVRFRGKPIVAITAARTIDTSLSLQQYLISIRGRRDSETQIQKQYRSAVKQYTK